jgi:hypothetical protein
MQNHRIVGAPPLHNSGAGPDLRLYNLDHEWNGLDYIGGGGEQGRQLSKKPLTFP